ncbi:hypothetical protein ASPWEDRAFT_31465 [Aspergillus wentii DTO 134E9]|uniref:Uncharacterized protein n=1 Tax=Aspergillus wentii DTO 134E9 TaxID=1073089 RepID=A0A1L9RCG0_ASPWE|nr:uncharacterized protein ASPWEDRAFT_31465 [Aspergillus wentii DTO 134E9]KAI9935136.1 hypothetical protein MW887_000757 [Aspergillus wentii]OJJ32578.1 hypothetical protein ASPWEDRAFT_31465 [Aspergillus wentii DTO 134E9]
MASPLDFINQADGIYEIHNAKEHPQLWQAMDNPGHPLNVAWPLFLDQDATFTRYYPKLVEYEQLARHQYAITETDSAGNVSIVACARSVPFYWPGDCLVDGTGEINHEALQKLPQGGYDTILARGVRQYLSRHNLPGASIALTEDQERDFWVCQSHNPPNALSAISITVRPDRRRRGLAEALIQTMKQTAIQQQLHLLVVPLRPTRKADFPTVLMDEYVRWPNPKGCGPFDPWLRKHVQLGAQIIKVAPTSMVVSGSVAEWTKWTKMDIEQLLQRMCPQDVSLESRTNKLYVEVSFPGGLVPLRYYFKEGRCLYTEPNVWLFHDLQV